MKEPRVNLPNVAGFQWKYRGLGWKPDYTCTYATYAYYNEPGHSCSYGKGKPSGYDSMHYWEGVPTRPSTDELIKKALSVLNGKLKCSLHFKPTQVIILNKDSICASIATKRYIHDNGYDYAVVLADKDFNYPIELVEEAKPVTVKLEHGCFATVHGDDINLGNHYYTIEDFKKIIEAHTNLCA